MAIGMQPLDLDPAAQNAGAALGQIAGHAVVMGVAVVVGDDGILHQPAQNVGAGPAKGALGGRVEFNDPARGIGDDDAIQRGGQDRIGQFVAAEGDCLGHGLALGSKVRGAPAMF